MLSRRVFLASLLGLSTLFAAAASRGEEQKQLAWYKGSIHAHSLWSDGDDFPEMVADGYKGRGYHFLALTDHDTLSRGERWISPFDKKKPVAAATIENCRKRFGDDWVETRGEGDKLTIRLKPLEEFRGKLEERGKFLLVESEEITAKTPLYAAHITALNLAAPIRPAKGIDVLETLRVNLQAVEEQSRRTGRSMLAQVNHPNWRYYDITPEELAGAVEARFFEVCNNSPGANFEGDEHHPGAERLWDIANTLRIARMKAPPLFGTATDDAHDYHAFRPNSACPGRGWVMVRAGGLTVESLLEAMRRGDFYATTGVVLRAMTYDPAAGTVAIEVEPKPGVHYTIEFIGTLEDVDLTAQPYTAPAVLKLKRPPRTLNRYSPEIGKVLARTQGTSATYRLTGKELYVRAVIRSDRTLANPPQAALAQERAWCQPVGWEERGSK